MPRERIRVSAAGIDRLAVLAPIFGAAFVDEPMMLWPMGSARVASERLSRCFAYFLESALDLGIVSEAIPARRAAVWIPPGRSDEWLEHPWSQDRIRKLQHDGGHRYDDFWRWVDSNSPAEPLWHLDSIAVAPEFQGHGCGGALIRDGLARARSDGIGAHLSTGTIRNVGFYATSGFAS